MSIKKCVNGSFVNDVYREYGTDTDTITSLPKTIIGDGQPISAYTIKGNMSQSGTPTPSNPVYPTECGEKTANLLDYKDITTTPNYATVTLITNGVNLTGKYMATIDMSLEINKAYYMSWTQQVVSGTADTGWRFKYTDNTYSNYGLNGGSLTPNKEVSQVLLYVTKSNDTASVDFTNIMFSNGNIPYEPYGYKIPISFNQTTYNIYITEPLRKSLDGSNVYDELSSNGTLTRRVDENGDALATPTTEQVTVPTLTTTGTPEQFNVLTTLAPSEVSLTYHGWHEHQDTKFTT